jgi:hypothetical protein
VACRTRNLEAGRTPPLWSPSNLSGLRGRRPSCARTPVRHTLEGTRRAFSALALRKKPPRPCDSRTSPSAPPESRLGVPHADTCGVRVGGGERARGAAWCGCYWERHANPRRAARPFGLRLGKLPCAVCVWNRGSASATPLTDAASGLRTRRNEADHTTHKSGETLCATEHARPGAAAISIRSRLSSR